MENARARYYKEWAKNNAEKKRATNKRWAKNNPERKKANNERWAKKNIEKIKAKQRAKMKEQRYSEHKKCICGRSMQNTSSRCIVCSSTTIRIGTNHPSWKGGRLLTRGYIRIYAPEHPYCNNNGYVREHRLVMEYYLGRYLTNDEVVHHIDFDPKNNDIDNLHLFNSDSEHTAYHMKLQSYVTDMLNCEEGFKCKN